MTAQPTPPASSDRHRFLDGLRGLLALQVVALHYVSAFAPSLSSPVTAGGSSAPLQAWFAGTPLFYLIDGYSAVFIFFLMSGFVLSRAFTGQEDRPFRNIGRRAIRLLIPTTGALLLAFLLFRLLPHVHVEAARVSHSAWLMDNATGVPTIRLLLHEIFRNAAIIGYHGSSLFDFSPLRYLASPGNGAASLDAPLWTLHVELYGSFLLIVLMFLRHRIRHLYIAVAIALTLTIPCAPIYLFLIGHLMYLFERRYLIGRRIPTSALAVAGYGLLVVGIVICGRKNIEFIAAIYIWLATHSFLVSLTIGGFESEIGAICIFVGVLLVVWANARRNVLRRILESRWVQLSGKYSFSVYLVHFPILLTIGCSLYVALASSLPRQVLAIAVFLLGTAITIPFVLLFDRFVDANAIRWSRLLKARRASVPSAASASVPPLADAVSAR